MSQRPDDLSDDRYAQALAALKAADVQCRGSAALERRVLATFAASTAPPAASPGRAAGVRRLAMVGLAAAASVLVAVALAWSPRSPIARVAENVPVPTEIAGASAPSAPSAPSEPKTPSLGSAREEPPARAARSTRRPARRVPAMAAATTAAEAAIPMAESLQLVRVRMAPADLALFGVPLPDADPLQRVDVELVVGLDGVPVGVRRIQIVPPAVP